MNKELASIKINQKYFDIIASNHASERMVERNVDPYVVAGNIITLGPEKINQLQQNDEESIIIDKDKDVSIVVGFNPESITVITVINRANVFVKENTSIYNI